MLPLRFLFFLSCIGAQDISSKLKYCKSFLGRAIYKQWNLADSCSMMVVETASDYCLVDLENDDGGYIEYTCKDKYR